MSHSGFISEKGQIYTLGSNAHGALGIGQKDVISVFAPSLVEGLSRYSINTLFCFVFIRNLY